jgi:hypothetical protein
MRAAVLHLAFAGLGAAEAVSGAFDDNAPSLGVSEKLGYESDGIERLAASGARHHDAPPAPASRPVGDDRAHPRLGNGTLAVPAVVRPPRRLRILTGTVLAAWRA